MTTEHENPASRSAESNLLAEQMQERARNVTGTKKKLFIITIMSFLVFVLMGEGILQIHFRLTQGQWFRSWVANRKFHVAFTAPVSDRREFALRAGYRDRFYTINSKGFRGRPIPRDHEGALICALGDSVFFGHALLDYEAYPQQLEWKYQQAGYAVRVLNAGVPSYNIRQSLDRFFQDVYPHYRPNLVTLQAANDMSLLTYFRERWTPDTTWASLRYKDTWGSSGLSNNLVSFHRLSNLNPGTEKKEEVYRRFPADKLLVHLDATLDQQLQFFEDNEIAVILLPIDMFTYSTDPDDRRNSQLQLWAKWKNHRSVFSKVAEGINESLKMKADGSENAYFLDIREVMDRQNRDEMFVDGFHYSARGGEVVAGTLFEFIEQHRLLPEEAKPDSAMLAALQQFDNYYNQGVELTQQKRHRAAVPLYQKAIQTLPDNQKSCDAYNNLGWSLAQLGEFEEAIEAYERALELRPGAERPRNNLARARQELEKQSQ